jgi:ABC-type sugar transport system ATPase subunit
MMDPLTVAENILAGKMPKGPLGLVSWSKVFSEASERLTQLGLDLNVRQRVEGLSVAEQTMLAIAKALFGQAKLIILDEPTASLPRADIDRLFGFIRALKDSGSSFVYISHHLEEVFEICDRVTILRDGQLVGTFDVHEIDMAGLTRHIVGEDVQEYQRTSALIEEPVLSIQGLTKRGHYENVNLTLSKGEVIGISGLQGCGAETVVRGLYGLEPWGIGEVYLNGQYYVARSPKHALDQGVAYLPQDRARLGMIGVRPVRENVTYTVLDQLTETLFNIVNRREETITVAEFIDQLEIMTPSQEQMVRLLSGGNQQKVVFAKLAATKPSVLLLHEPTMGVDVRAKQDIYRIIDELSKQGVAIIIVSSEVRELIGVCDRILVMYEGRITQEFKQGELQTTPENILLAIEGGHRGNND